MLSALLITFREGLEAALLVGLLLAVLGRAAAPISRRWVWSGVAAAAAVSAAAGAALFAAGAELEGTAEALFEAAAMLTAAAMLVWMIVWMSRQARSLRGRMDARVAAAAGAGALFWLAFAVVVREGLETALFLFAAAGAGGSAGAFAGGVLGLSLAVSVGYAVYRFGERLNVGALFRVLNVLLLTFGAYLVWAGAGELGEVAGGEAGELAGPLAAGLYVVIVVWLLRRARRATGTALRPGAAAGPGAAVGPGSVTGRPKGE